MTSCGSTWLKCADHVGEAAERRLGRLHRLGAHDVLDAQPVLEVGRADDVEQHQRAAGVLRAARGVEQRARTFRRVVDDDQELAPVAFLGAFAWSAAMGSCCHSAGARDKMTTGSSCHALADEADHVLDAAA